MVNGCLGDFVPDPHGDCNDDEDKEDAAEDTKNLQSGALFQEVGGGVCLCSLVRTGALARKCWR